MPGRIERLSLAEYEDALAARQTSERWHTATRVFQREVRNFFLFRAGSEPVDSRSTKSLAAEIQVTPEALEAVEGELIVLGVRVTNTGSARWLCG